MGLVIIGMLIFIAIFILFVISLCALLVVYLLIESKKVGFLRAVKSKTALAIIVLIFICGGIPPLLFISMSTPLSGNQIFEDLILDPIPESVEILGSFDGSPDFRGDYCLHFKISPDDFKLILADKDWEVVSEKPFGVECEPGPHIPESLDDNVIIYYYDENNISKIMVTNTQMSEVYYSLWNGNAP